MPAPRERPFRSRCRLPQYDAVIGLAVPAAAERFREVDDRQPRIAGGRDAQRLGGEQRALRVEHFEVRRAAGFVAKRRNRLGLFELVAAAAFRRLALRPRFVGHERVVHFAKRGLHGLPIIHRHLVAPRFRRLDLRLDGLQAQERLQEPSTEAPHGGGGR
jgi:hypothetical protein